jgi:hypothetical protein
VDAGNITGKLAFPPVPDSAVAKAALTSLKPQQPSGHAPPPVPAPPLAVRPETTSLGACATSVSSIATLVLDFALSGSDFTTMTSANSGGFGSVTTPTPTEIVVDLTITDIPAGSGRTLTSTLAINNVVTCSGTVSGITIVSGGTTDVGTVDMTPTGAKLPLPDLTCSITSVTKTGTGSSSRYTVSMTVTNSGTVAVPSSQAFWDVHILTNSASEPTQTSIVTSYDDFYGPAVSALSAAQSTSTTRSNIAATVSTTPTTGTVWAYVDPHGVVSEANETNNTCSKAY